MYQIGPFAFEIRNPGVPVPENLRAFHVDGGEAPYVYALEIADAPQMGTERMLLQKDRICISAENGLETRYLRIPGMAQPYAVSRETDALHTHVQVARRMLEQFRLDTMFGSLLAPERRLAQKDCYVLHSAYLVHEGRAILFSGPSGMGKSTQADLWKKYRGAELINGDRSLLQLEGGRLWACGWPVCGSSGVCRNEKYPVAAIVMLSQGRENVVAPMGVREAIPKLTGQITINYHNPAFVDGALRFLERLMACTPVYHLRCDISEQAVETLERRLRTDSCL